LVKEKKTKAPVKKKAVAVKKTTRKTVTKPKTKDNTQKLLEAIVDGIEDKKGEDIVTLNLKQIKNAMADYFVICQASNKIQVEAIVRSIEEKVYKKTKEDPRTVEGKQNAEWVLLDYFNVVVHVFIAEKRDFYGLENLWADAVEEKIASGS